MQDRKMFYGASGNTFRKAFLLRNRETEAEKLLWERLSKSKLGYRFKRQHPTEYFIADFYCHKAKLVIELDGRYHGLKDQMRYDVDRTKVMESFGLKVLRFKDEEIFQELDLVVEKTTVVLTESTYKR
jgi:imidazole glycerol-phosphate synthase subunit HisF